MAGFLLSAAGLSIELRSIIRRTTAHPFGASATARCSTPAALVRVRAPLFREPSLWLGFCFLRPDSPSNSVRLFAARRLTPSGPARQARCSTPAALVRVRAPLFRTRLWRVFAFCGRTLHRTPFDYSPRQSSFARYWVETRLSEVIPKTTC
jgi:hypothetical protein